MNRVTALRVSLLVSMGIVPVACGGTTEHVRDDTKGGSGGASAGATSTAGKPSKGGSSNQGGSGIGGTGIGGTGMGGTGMGGTGMGGTGMGGTGMGVCKSPTTDPVSGLIKCQQGFTHRPKAVECGAVGGAPADLGAGGDNGGDSRKPRANGTVACGDNEAICNQFELGYCRGSGQLAPTCVSGCIVDADCGAGFVCNCDGYTAHGGTCVPSDCATDADCGVGSFCASSAGPCGDASFQCQRAVDECTTNADCGGSVCATLDNHRQCFHGACGRPFLVQTEARVAPVVADGVWAQSALRPRVDHLTSTERAALAQHWTKMGQMEHASIAAFARFQLQLLALGAPPELVDACTQALADETAHTRLCFALASAFAGRAIGPGPLDIDHSLNASTLVDVVDLVILEGCFGETSAALEAQEAADSATDRLIADTYAKIAEDEQRHAELAFRFLRWALERGGKAVRDRVEQALTNPPLYSHDARAVTLPCLEALLSATRH